jgi:hypothetical protein
MNKNNLQALEPLQPYFMSRKGISRTSLCRGILNKICHQIFFPTSRSTWENKKNSTNKLRMRTTFQRFLNQDFFFGSWVAVFSRDPSRWSIGSYVPFSTRKPHAKAVPKKDYFMQQKQYHQRTTLRTWPWKMRERVAEWSAPTIARHIHGTSVLLGT